MSPFVPKDIEAVNPLHCALTPQMQLNVSRLLGRSTRIRAKELDKLTQEVPFQILADQVAVADRITSLIDTGIRSYLEDIATSLYEGTVSGGSRHSFCLMGAYAENPLEEYSLGRFDGSDLLCGREVDLFGDDKEARRALRTIRTEEGVGLLKIFDGKYTLANSGLAFPFKGKSGEYNPSEKRGMMISSVLEFSREYHPAWFFRLNNGLSLIHNGKTYELEYD